MRTEAVTLLPATGGGDSGRRRRVNLASGEDNQRGGGEKPGSGGTCSSWRRGARAGSNLLPNTTNRERESARGLETNRTGLSLSRSYLRRLAVGIAKPEDEEGTVSAASARACPHPPPCLPPWELSLVVEPGTSVGRWPMDGDDNAVLACGGCVVPQNMIGSFFFLRG